MNSAWFTAPAAVGAHLGGHLLEAGPRWSAIATLRSGLSWFLFNHSRSRAGPTRDTDTQSL